MIIDKFISSRFINKKIFILSVLLIFLINGKLFSQCPVNPEFSYYTISCCNIQFTDMSTVTNPNYTIVQWVWDFGDGGTSNIQNPQHTFAPGTTYNVMLTITADSSGVTCNDSINHPVVIDDLPTIYFTWNPEPTCLGSPTYFYGTSGGNIVSWAWDFGDGGSSSIQEPIHLYLFTGTFNVSLTVTDVNGCDTTLIQQVNVVDIPDVDFTVNPNPTCLNEPTTFTGTSASSIISWDWDFGDGYTANTQIAVHSYENSGIFNVVLTVVDINGCSNSVSYPVTVNPLPNPDFQHTAPACLGDSVYFTDYSTTPNGYIDIWHWNFGDGNTTTINFPGNPNVAHLYSITGTFDVTLTVTDSDGCIDSITKQVVIVPNPVANFTYSTACDGEPVQFTDLSSLNGGSSIVSWYWEFGDPLSGIYNTSILQNPTHIFTSADTFNVTLVVINIDDCSDTITLPVIVDSLPDVDFTIDRDTTCVGELVSFYGTGTNIVSWSWDFGDGGTSIQQEPQYAYALPGTYDVTLTVIDINGCSNWITHPVYVNPLPTAYFEAGSPNCLNDSVYFTDYSTTPNGYIDIWHWYFGDGQDTIIYFPDNPNVAHLYSNVGIYTASLAITDSDGCIDSTSNEITIIASPIANFEYSTACYQESVQFTDLSLENGGSAIIAWYWDFGDPLSGVNNYSTYQNPNHVFTDTGTYIVSLTAFNASGCFDTISLPVYVNPLPDIDFTVDDDSTCVASEVFFYGTGTDIILWLWDFGDGGTANVQNPVYIYNTAGIYDVTLTATDLNECTNYVTHPVLVNELPTAKFSYESNCFSDTTRFFDQSYSNSSAISSWYWNFDDPASAPNDTSTLQNPSHLFTQAGNYYVSLIVTDYNGCIDSIINQVQVFDLPEPDFSFQVVCDPPGTVYFFDNSSPGGSGSPIIEWNWHIDEGYYSTEINPHYTYSTFDTCYIVTLTVTDMNLCSNSYIDTVCISDPLTVDFTSTTVCFKNRTEFQASYLPSDDSVTSWKWDFGDGNPPVSTPHDTISYLYSAPGLYFVVLTATDVNNCTASIYHNVVVDSLPVPNFAATTVSCDEPTQFYDLSTGGGTFIQSWYWDFGDISSGANNYSTLQNPSHLYGPEDSTYYVLLRVTNYNGCVDSIILPVVKDPCVIASFEAPTEFMCTDYQICFTDNSYIFQGAGTIINWNWDFGDGNTYSYTNYENPVCHAYSGPGFYNVSLVITALVNSSTFTDTATQTIYINPSPTADFASNSNCLGVTTDFADLSVGNGLPITDWHWDFGDPLTINDTSILQNPTYIYTLPGIYDVELIVSNEHGCSDTIILPVEIFALPIADFEFSTSCVGDATYFYDMSDSSGTPIISWFWDFGDSLATNDTSILRNPIYVYNSTGIHNVKLIITNENLCIDTITKDVEVYTVPSSDFRIIENYQGTQGQIYLENLTTGASSYEWDLGNGETSEEINPVVTYLEDGTYVIQLIAWNDYNCPDTTEQEYELLFKGLYIPNAFSPRSPNADVRLFQPKGINLKQYIIEVYSSWGNLVWKSKALDDDGCPEESWDGTYQNKLLPMGAYIWKVTAIFRDNTYWEGSDNGDGNLKTYGTITLIH
ncbi:MAG: PKD domain-containing protein [Bacteroidetes bacterium]|nr:PKD domain-containing protein [Bacteroidota bacterium]